MLTLAAYHAIPRLLKYQFPEPAIMPEAGDVGTLLVIFQPADCSSYGSFITDWRRVATDSISVVGVPVNAEDSTALARAVATFPVQFAVRPDLSSTALSLAARLGHLQTPIAILLDSDGKARMVIRGFGATPRQLDVEQLVMDYRHIAIRSAP
jgi:hypothetical protein